MTTEKPAGGHWFQAAFIAFWGVLCLLVALDVVDMDARVPAWMLVMLGVAFLVAALYLVTLATGGEERRSGLDVFLKVWIGPIAILTLAVAFVWVGFGPGTRQHGSGPLRMLFGPRVGAIETRVVFGGVGVLFSALAIGAFWSTWRSWRSQQARDEVSDDASAADVPAAADAKADVPKPGKGLPRRFRR